MCIRDSTYQVPKEVSYAEVIVPTNDSIRMEFVLNRLLMNGKHCLFVGPTGTGKSIVILNELKNSFDNEQWMNVGMSFSAKTSAN